MADGIQAPPFYLLNGQLGWRTGESRGLSLGVQAGMRLAADPSGPLALTSPDGSLGGLLLPRGMALDGREGNLYLLEGRAPWRLKRFDPVQERFVELQGIGGRGADPRRFDRPGGIAIAGRNLYVAEADNSRVQVFDLASLALRYLWEAVGERGDWRPVDVAAGETWVYILDGAQGRVYRHRPGADPLHRLFTALSGGQWRRIAVDRDGRIYLLDLGDSNGPRLAVFSPEGDFLEEKRDAGDVRDRFPAPALHLFFDARRKTSYFCLPESLVRLCGRALPAEPPALEVPLALCPPWAKAQPGLLFNRDGELARVDPAELIEAPLYRTRGYWISQALDSRRYRCQWDRVEVDFSRLPPGSQVTVSTFAADEDAGRPAQSSPMWEAGLTLVGEMQPPGAPAVPGAPRTTDFLVQSRQGQFLWLKIEVRGDGFDTPALQALRVRFPRESYLSYLPAVYASDDETRWFLERFLSIFQTEWDAIERRVENSAALFDPAALPASGGFLELLAHWLALPLEDTWKAEQKRNLLHSVPQVYPQRGTQVGLRAHLQAYLQNITGMPPGEQGDYPRLVEGFRLRQRLMLPGPGEQPTGQARLLWGPAMVGRFQTGVFSRPSEVRLVSTGDPQRELFHEYAHRFQVFVPAAWVRSADDERMLRRALEAEKPAQAAYDLCLVEPRFRVGLQSTVGLDTILGDYPVARLSCQAELDAAAPSRSPRHRLGYDTILAGRDEAPRHLPLPVHFILN